LLDIVKATKGVPMDLPPKNPSSSPQVKDPPADSGGRRKLTPKLQTIFDHLLPGEDVWDLCCDHGYLGRAALEAGTFGTVYFVDRVPHIIEKLQTEISAEERLRKARFRAADGGELQENLCGTVVIAGVGAYTAFAILKTLYHGNFLRAKRLILSPQRDEQKLLQWLNELDEKFKHRYQLRIEQVVREGRRPLWIYICGP
jgi:tRNA (adenine22-N1)-methyltransferase